MAKVQPAVVILMIIFVAVMTLGLQNIVIGIIVDRTNMVIQAKREEQICEERMMHLEKVQMLADQIFGAGADVQEWITKQDLVEKGGLESFQEALRACKVPHGFTLRDLHTMLDRSLDGYMTYTEFVEGMFRLIFCDDFQRGCMIQLSIYQIKRLIAETKDGLIEALKKEREASAALIKSMQDEIDRLRAELCADWNPRAHATWIQMYQTSGSQPVHESDYKTPKEEVIFASSAIEAREVPCPHAVCSGHTGEKQDVAEQEPEEEA